MDERPPRKSHCVHGHALEGENLHWHVVAGRRYAVCLVCRRASKNRWGMRRYQDLRAAGASSSVAARHGRRE